MSRKGRNIYKRKDGRWEGRYILGYDYDGKVKFKYVYGKSYGETRKKVELLSVDTHIVCTQKEDHSIEVMMQHWLKSNQPRIKESTYIKYYNLIKNHIDPILGKKNISAISTQDLEIYRNHLLTSGKLKGEGGLSPKTVSDTFSIIRSVLEYAQNTFGLPVCSAKSIKVRSEDKMMRILTLKEQEKLCSYLNRQDTLTDLGVLVCLYTGMRIGEICALTWQDISFEEEVIHVSKTMQRLQCLDPNSIMKTKVLISKPKSNCSLRSIPIPRFLMELLKQHIPSNKKAYFLTGKVNQYVEPRNLQFQFQKLLKKCGIEKINFHSLRHTFATRCVEVNFDVKSLSEILGHANVNITLNRYVHPTLELKRENMKKLELLEYKSSKGTVKN